MKLYMTLLTVLISIPVAAADEPAQLRLLALGEMPPFRQEIRDGVRRELDPPAGSIPPRTLEAPAPEAKAAPPVFRLILGSPSPAVTVTPVEGRVALSETGQGKWLEVPCPPASRTLAILWRPGKSWDRPQVLALPELTAKYDPRSFRFVNVAPQAVGIVFGDKRLQLQSGRSIELVLPPEAKEATVTVMYSAEDGLKPCFSGAAQVREGSATQFFIHRADGEAARRPVAVTVVSGPTS